MYIRIHTITPHPESGKKSVINKIALYTDDDKWVKFVTVERCERLLRENKIQISDDIANRMVK